MNPVEILFIDKINGCVVDSVLTEDIYCIFEEDFHKGWKYDLLDNDWKYLKEYSKFGFENFNIQKLKEELKEKKLKVSGKRAELLERLELSYKKEYWEWHNYFGLKYNINNEILLDSVLEKGWISVDEITSTYQLTSLGKKIIEENESVFFFDKYISLTGGIEIQEYFNKLTEEETYEKTLIKLLLNTLEHTRNNKLFHSWGKVLTTLISIYEDLNLYEDEIDMRTELYSLNCLSSFGYDVFIADLTNQKKLEAIYQNFSEIAFGLAVSHLIKIGFLDYDKDYIMMAGLSIPLSTVFKENKF